MVKRRLFQFSAACFKQDLNIWRAIHKEELEQEHNFDKDCQELKNVIELPIQNYLIPALCFPEKLTLYENGISCGHLALTVDLLDEKIFSIFLQIKLGNNVNELFCYCDKNFNIFEENKSEINKTEEIQKHFTLFFDTFLGKIILTKAEKREKRLQNFYSDEFSNKYLVTDGMNILLLRYLVLKDFVGKITSKYVTCNGEVRKCVINFLELNQLAINGKHLKVKTVKTVYFLDLHEKQRTKTITHFKPNGHLLRHKWINSKYECKVIGKGEHLNKTWTTKKCVDSLFGFVGNQLDDAWLNCYTS